MTRFVLTIAGSDPLGGAGVQADIKTIHAHQLHALSVISAINAQNTAGVQSVFALPAEQVASQLDALLNDLPIDAIKIGQLASREIIELLANRLAALNCPIVLDPVLVSSSGKPLLPESAWPSLPSLWSSMSVITPNIPEVNALLGTAFVGISAEMPSIAEQLFAQGIRAAVVKGGHSADDQAVDYLLLPGESPLAFSQPRLAGLNVKGTGCAFSSALTCRLAQGHPLPNAVKLAKDFLFERLQQRVYLKSGSNLSVIQAI